MNISKITIGRLYNLGNYEHIRYELTAEVPQGENPTMALKGLENIIAALSPDKPHSIPTEADLRRAEEAISAISTMGDDQVATQYGKSKTIVLYEQRKKLTQARAKRERWEVRQEHARALLNDLGGAAVWKDAKQDWDQDDDWD